MRPLHRQPPGRRARQHGPRVLPDRTSVSCASSACSVEVAGEEGADSEGMGRGGEVGEGVGGDLGVWMSSGELREDWGSIAGG